MKADELLKLRVSAAKALIAADAAKNAAFKHAELLGLSARNLQNIGYLDGRGTYHSLIPFLRTAPDAK